MLEVFWSYQMKRALSIVAMLALAAVPAAAQTEGKISVGGSVSYVIPTDSEVDRSWARSARAAQPQEGLGYCRRPELVSRRHRQSSTDRR